MKQIFLSSILLLCLMTLPALAALEPEAEHVAVHLIPERTTIKSGESLWVAIEQVIEPEWHTYWINPGDSGTTPTLTWALPDGFKTGQLMWPAPHRIPYAGMVNYGYEGRAVLLQELMAPAPLPDGSVKIHADVEILVCRDICIPEIKSIDLTLNDPNQTPQENDGLIDAAFNEIPNPVQGKGQYTADGNELVVMIYSDFPNVWQGIDPASFALFPAEWGIAKNNAPTRVERQTTQQLFLRQERNTRDISEISELPVVFSYTGQDGHYQAMSITLKPHSSLKNLNPAPDSVAPSLSFFQAIIFALLGGIVLNLMPCVFPVLSIKALKLVQIRDRGYGQTVLHGLAYTAGVVLSFAAVAGVLMSLKAAGDQIGWGFQLQNPMIVLGLSYLLFVIGLNLSGVFNLGGSFTGAGSSLAGKSGLSGSFFTGVLATLVATPCTAPFMAGAIGFALIQPAPMAMMIFLSLGFGLALPYLLLCLIPSIGRILPRPGQWMEKFKEFLAFPMYASAAWMVWVLSMQTTPTGALWALMGMIALAFALWVAPHKSSGLVWRILLPVIAFLALAFALLPFFNQTILQAPPTAIQSVNASTHGEAETYSKERLAQALQGDDPVFVYMTAAWCITCKVNEKVALHTDTTRNLFRNHRVTVLEGDWTRQDPAITAYLKSYGRSGVPLYVFYGSKEGDQEKRPDPVVLPQVLTPGLIKNLFKETSSP